MVHEGSVGRVAAGEAAWEAREGERGQGPMRGTGRDPTVLCSMGCTREQGGGCTRTEGTRLVHPLREIRAREGRGPVCTYVCACCGKYVCTRAMRQGAKTRRRHAHHLARIAARAKHRAFVKGRRHVIAAHLALGISGRFRPAARTCMLYVYWRYLIRVRAARR